MMRSGIIAAVSIGLLLATPEAASSEGPEPPPRVVNVTADSAPGWLPSEELERAARKTAADFLAAKDDGRYADAYRLLADLNRQDQPFADFSEDLRQFNAEAGKVMERRIVTITWTKDPSDAPLPGVYAAIDLVSRFANIDRHCGYVVLWQDAAGGDLRVMREESNFITNEAARKSVELGLAQGVEEVWSQLSANCPNYPGRASAPASLLESPESTIGYPTVAAALADLRSKPGVVFTTENGWTIATDEAARAIWSFSPIGYPAHPAVVKREVIEQDQGVVLTMSVQCEASKTDCDALVRTFQALNPQFSGNVDGDGR